MKYTIYKELRLKVEIEADSAQEAYETQLHFDDNTFQVLECDYSVFDAANNNVSEEVVM